MARYHGRRRQRRRLLLGNLYLSSNMQYGVTVVSAIVLAGLVFSGTLLFRYTAEQDLIAEGQQLIKEGKVAKAEEVLRKLVTTHNDSYDGHLLLGKVYLDLGDRDRAEQQFKAASMLKSHVGDAQAADIAMSKLDIVQKNFDSAEKFLLPAYNQHSNDPDVKEALFELYDNWGDSLANQDPKDYDAVIGKYEAALRYVDEYQEEDRVKEKLLDTISDDAENLTHDNQYDKAIAALQQSLKYRYLPDTLVAIADDYDHLNKTDDAIDWYRKAFEADPGVISLRLTDVLLKKGRQLLDAKKPQEAQKYFDEADQVSKAANVPLDQLYPVRVTDVGVHATLDSETGEFLPKIQVKFENDSGRTIGFLAAKAVIMSGDKEITTISDSVASPDKPMLPLGKDKKSNIVTITLKPDGPLNVHNLPQKQIIVKIYVAYNEGENQVWKEKATHEVVIKEGQTEAAPSAAPVPPPA